MSLSINKDLANEDATVEFGCQLAGCLRPGCMVYLHGELGAGKTTLVRAVLQGLGHHGRVKSPTYTLVERYDLELMTVFHFDLYRLADPEELEFLGIRDYLESEAIIFVEWPEKGCGFLADPDIDITLSYHNDARKVNCTAVSQKGELCLRSLAS